MAARIPSKTRHLAEDAIDIIVNINSDGPKYQHADAVNAEVALLEAHINGGNMSQEDKARAYDTIAQIREGKRSFGKTV